MTVSNSQPRTDRFTAWALIAILAIGQPAFAADQYGQVLFSGVPVPGATVTAAQGEKKVAATTDADGVFRLVDLAAGVWTLTVEMLGFATETRDVTVPTEGEPPSFALKLKTFDEISRDLPVQRQEPLLTVGPPTGAAAQQARGPAAATTGPAAPQPGFQRAGVTQANTAPPARPVAALPDAAPTDPGGAADGLLINGSVNNGASTPFAQPRAFGNARPNQRSLYTYATGIPVRQLVARRTAVLADRAAEREAVVQRRPGARHVPGPGTAAADPPESAERVPRLPGIVGHQRADADVAHADGSRARR